MTDKQLDELVIEEQPNEDTAVISTATARRLLRQVRDQVTAETESRVRRETLREAAEVASSYISCELCNNKQHISEELRRAAEDLNVESAEKRY